MRILCSELCCYKKQLVSTYFQSRLSCSVDVVQALENDTRKKLLTVLTWQVWACITRVVSGVVVRLLLIALWHIVSEKCWLRKSKWCQIYTVYQIYSSNMLNVNRVVQSLPCWLKRLAAKSASAHQISSPAGRCYCIVGLNVTSEFVHRLAQSP